MTRYKIGTLGFLKIPGSSVDGLKVRLAKRSASTGELRVIAVESRQRPDGSPGWVVGDSLQVKPYEFQPELLP